jgi:hypothetical protein
MAQGPQQNLSSSMPNSGQQRPGIWAESKDRDIASEVQVSVRIFMKISNIKKFKVMESHRIR